MRGRSASRTKSVEENTGNVSFLRETYLGLRYQKIATATSSAVMIQRIMSFAVFFSFSSAISADSIHETLALVSLISAWITLYGFDSALVEVCRL